MNTNDITRAVTAASRILKGDTKPTVTLREVEDAMIALGTARKRAGESPAAAFSRLVADGDSDMITLAKAAERLRIAADTKAPTLKKQVRQLHAEAAERLDTYVGLAKHDDEDVSATYARLAKERCPTFLKLWQHLRDCADAAQ